jgi:hypothetical protein
VARFEQAGRKRGLSYVACAMAEVIVVAVGVVAGASLHGIRPRLCRLVDLGSGKLQRS